MNGKQFAYALFTGLFVAGMPMAFAEETEETETVAEVIVEEVAAEEVSEASDVVVAVETHEECCGHCSEE